MHALNDSYVIQIAILSVISLLMAAGGSALVIAYIKAKKKISDLERIMLEYPGSVGQVTMEYIQGYLENVDRRIMNQQSVLMAALEDLSALKLIANDGLERWVYLQVLEPQARYKEYLQEISAEAENFKNIQEQHTEDRAIVNLLRENLFSSRFNQYFKELELEHLVKISSKLRRESANELRDRIKLQSRRADYENLLRNRDKLAEIGKKMERELEGVSVVGQIPGQRPSPSVRMLEARRHRRDTTGDNSM